MYEMFLLDSSFFCWKEERFYKYITKPTLDDFSLNLYFYSYAAIVYVLIIVYMNYYERRYICFISYMSNNLNQCIIFCRQYYFMSPGGCGKIGRLGRSTLL